MGHEDEKTPPHVDSSGLMGIIISIQSWYDSHMNHGHDSSENIKAK